jgi:hypothetical protein
VPQAPPEFKATLEPQVLQDSKALLAHQDYLDQLAYKVLQVLQDTLELLVLLVLKVLLV